MMRDCDNYAYVFDIKRFALHDGPGIRSTLFVKGCPLNCAWCQNPEGLSMTPDLWYQSVLCIGCQTCVGTCPENALGFEGSVLRIDKEKCTKCGCCTESCPTLALRSDAWRMSGAEAAEELLKDEKFFANSGGGCTISGGECTCVPEFTIEVLRRLKQKGISTAIETCLYTKWDTLSQIVRYTDLVIADIKLYDAGRHIACTGSNNAIILDNLRRLCEEKTALLVRIPMIPGFTADAENLQNIAAYLSGIEPEIDVELLNYNPLCMSKYTALDEKYPIPPEARPFSEQEMEGFKSILHEHGMKNVF